MEPTLAQIVLFAGNFAPRGWAFCQGQILPINQNQALFSLLGTTYGGDGRTSFALPDLRGRAPVQQGTGPGLSQRRLGQKGGEETHQLTVNEIANHDHTYTPQASSNEPSVSSAAGNVLGAGEYYAPPANLTNMGGTTTTEITGASQAHTNMQPSISLNYIICLQGLFPSRS